MRNYTQCLRTCLLRNGTVVQQLESQCPVRRPEHWLWHWMRTTMRWFTQLLAKLYYNNTTTTAAQVYWRGMGSEFKSLVRLYWHWAVGYVCVLCHQNIHYTSYASDWSSRGVVTELWRVALPTAERYFSSEKHVSLAVNRLVIFIDCRNTQLLGSESAPFETLSISGS